MASFQVLVSSCINDQSFCCPDSRIAAYRPALLLFRNMFLVCTPLCTFPMMFC
ncbi:hypothetical protein HanPSC8_Chr01g0001791 [Helianthus annuus]|nr:hypothetical protein HanPSC8_Chr01g0001791 [Helianthus annuus]